MTGRGGVTEDDVVLLRAGSGTIHLGIRLGRGGDTMCCQMISSPVLLALQGDAAEAYLTEQRLRYFCDDCAVIGEKPWPIVKRITGWT